MRVLKLKGSTRSIWQGLEINNLVFALLVTAFKRLLDKGDGNESSKQVQLVSKNQEHRIINSDMVVSFNVSSQLSAGANIWACPSQWLSYVRMFEVWGIFGHSVHLEKFSMSYGHILYFCTKQDWMSMRYSTSVHI